MVMKTSTQRKTWRPDQQLYVPGKGLLAKGSKSIAATMNDKEDSLKDITNVRVKNRRPDIQVYVPRAKLSALRSDGRSNSLSSDLPDLQKDNDNVEKTSSCYTAKDSSSVKIVDELANCVENCNQRIESLTVKSPSWADQVEEYLSNDAHLQEDTDRTSMSGYSYEDEKDLASNVDRQDIAYSSSYSSSSYESLSEQATSSNDEINFSHCTHQQSPQSRMVVQSASIRPVSAPVKLREAAHFPEPDTEEFREMMAKREAILDKQTAFFEKLAAKCKARESKQDGNSKSTVIQRLVIPTSSSKPTVSEVPEKVPCSKLNPHADIYIPVPKPCSTPSTSFDCAIPDPVSLINHGSSLPLNTDFYIPAPQLLSIPCTDVEHTFYASECLDSNHSPVPSHSVYIPPPRPCNVSYMEYSSSDTSPDHFSADFYIPPPRPCNVPSTGLDSTFYSSGNLNSCHSLDVADDFYIAPPRPVLIPRPVAKV